MAEVASLQAVFTANTTDFEAGAGRVEGRMRNVAGNIGQGLQSIGGNLQRLGSQMTLAFAPLGAMGSLALRESIRFEDAFAGVRKTVEATEGEFQMLQDNIRELATSPDHFTSSMEDAHAQLTKIMELGGQMGVEGVDNLTKFTETVGLLTMATDLTAERAATMIGQFANITGMPMDQIDKFGSALVALGNNFATTESRILEMSQRIAGAGTVAGFEPKEILAVATALSAAGIEAEAGGTAISRVITDINTAVLDGGPKLEGFAEIAGLTREEFAKNWSEAPAETLNAFIGGLRDANADGQNVVGILDDLELSGIRVKDALLRLSTGEDTLTDALRISNDAWDENTALMTEARARAETSQSKINVLKNTVRDLGISLGDSVNPELDKMIDKIIPVVDGVKQWVDANPELAGQLVTIGGALAVAGPILFIVGTAFNLLAGAVTGVVAALALLASPIAIAIGLGIGLGLAAVKLKNYIEENFGSIGEFADQLLTNMDIAFAGIIGVITAPADTLELMKDFFRTDLEAAAEIVASFKDSVVGFIDEIIAAINSIPSLGDAIAGDLSGLDFSPGANITTEGAAGRAGDLVGGFLRGIGFQGGTPWTGDMSTNEVAGMVHGQEAVVPAEGMRVIPSPRGLMLEGGGGGGRDVMIQTVNVYANDAAGGAAAAQAFRDEIELANIREG